MGTSRVAWEPVRRSELAAVAAIAAVPGCGLLHFLLGQPRSHAEALRRIPSLGREYLDSLGWFVLGGVRFAIGTAAIHRRAQVYELEALCPGPLHRARGMVRALVARPHPRPIGIHICPGFEALLKARGMRRDSSRQWMGWSPRRFGPTRIEGVAPPRACDARRLGDLLFHAYRGSDEEITDRGTARAYARRILLGRLGRCLRSVSRIVAWKGRWVAACIVVRTRMPRECLILELVVAPEARRQGLARALLRATLRDIAARAMGPCSLWVSEANLGAIRLYESLGFHARIVDQLWETRRS